jgi:uncharacterized protein YyaL (SSP411 family)
MKSESDYPYTNSLINESSPYLLQHAHNPVDWMPWNEVSLERAKNEDKLLIISIGYSACHWCHVMEHESFEDAGVAEIMNKHFVCIKVDREERPDVDQVYMDAVQLITGRGGWPLNAIALPDGRPIYAGTYFPKENWKQVLLYFVDYWKKSREEAFERAAEITNGVRGMDVIKDSKFDTSVFTNETRNTIFSKFDATLDYTKGGRAGAPKFPMPINFRYLLRNYFYTKNPKTLSAVTVTLDNMMNGGIYDHVGGGFSRYSVDADWEIPHFEKMLYDNAQLVSLYSEAYQLTRNQKYKQVVYETLSFVERELNDKSGGFYSALDADSEGEEGKFYVWEYEELEKLLGNDFETFKTVFYVPEHGNFEGKINLVKSEKYSVEEAQIVVWKNLLLKHRSNRIRPSLDDKILTSWNALMLKGYIDAYKAFDDEKFLNRALSSASFIKENMLQIDGSLKRNFKNGKTSINGFLDDYSFTIEAYIALHETTFDEQWLQLALSLTNYAVQHFFNAGTGLFHYTSVNDAPLIARKYETSDNVIPASNSSLAISLYKLGVLFDKPEFIKMSERMLNTQYENLLNYPSFYANWALLNDYFIDAPFEVVVVGVNCENLARELNLNFLPNCIFTGSKVDSELPLLADRFKQGETYIYVCKNRTCNLPVKTVAEALQQLQ